MTAVPSLEGQAMETQDLVVGIVAALVGGALIAAKLQGWSWYRQMRLTRSLESRLGLAWAGRLAILLGLLLIVMGILIACGYSLVDWTGRSGQVGP